MKFKNKVSIWIGEFQDKEMFENMIAEIYYDNGDVSSKFMNSFNIDYIDNQFQEAIFLGEVISLDLLEGASYSESFIEDLEHFNFENNNSIILIYDFEYSGEVIEKDGLKYIGSFDFTVLDY